MSTRVLIERYSLYPGMDRDISGSFKNIGKAIGESLLNIIYKVANIGISAINSVARLFGYPKEKINPPPPAAHPVLSISVTPPPELPKVPSPSPSNVRLEAPHGGPPLPLPSPTSIGGSPQIEGRPSIRMLSVNSLVEEKEKKK